MTPSQDPPPRQDNGPEEKAARVLNVTMVGVLLAAVAVVASWSIVDFVWTVFATEAEVSWRDDFVTRLLAPIALLSTIVPFGKWAMLALCGKSPRGSGSNRDDKVT